MKSMNLEKISTLMDKFEKEFEDLDVQTSVMEGAMSQTTATSIPQDAVENLMKQVLRVQKYTSTPQDSVENLMKKQVSSIFGYTIFLHTRCHDPNSLNEFSTFPK